MARRPAPPIPAARLIGRPPPPPPVSLIDRVYLAGRIRLGAACKRASVNKINPIASEMIKGVARAADFAGRIRGALSELSALIMRSRRPGDCLAGRPADSRSPLFRLTWRPRKQKNDNEPGRGRRRRTGPAGIFLRRGRAARPNSVARVGAQHQAAVWIGEKLGGASRAPVVAARTRARAKAR